MLDKNTVNEIQKKIFINKSPFPYTLIKDALPLDIITKAENDFISFRNFERGDENFRYGNAKYSLEKFNKMPESIKNIISFFYSENFLKLLEKNFKLKDVKPDWTLYGAGMHNSARGNHLTVHSDFVYQRHNTKTRRVLNLLLYLNSDWKDEWNGHIELWDKKMTKKVQSISPSLNNMLLFRTDKDSNHGFPDKLLCPEHITRKSIALYYYVEEKSFFPIQIQKRKYFTTVWKKRPNTNDPDFMDRDNLWRQIKYKYLPRFFLKK
jgi:Rps23 Pro-64 3,4-dihydroxylase Tpa1-like proline 4-hydroxylase